MDPVVVIDRNAHTAILVGQGPTYVRLIEMRSGELVVTRLTEDEFVGRGFSTTPYDLSKAVRRFLAHPGGVSEAARSALERCLNPALPLEGGG